MAERQRESALLLCADIHYGRKTASYCPDACAERMGRIAQRLGRVRELLSGYDFDELRIAVLGDTNDGTDIYATQPHHQAIGNVERQAEEASTVLADFGRSVQRGGWGQVGFEVVPGNHGRAGHWAHEAANWDIVAYRYLGLKLAAAGIPVGMDTSGQTDLFLRKIALRGHRYVLYHGHDIRTYAGIPWYGILLRLSRWLSTTLAPFDVACMGHWHTLGTWQINRMRMFASGTMVGDDEWSLRVLGWESSQQWWLIGISDSRPVTWQIGIDLT